MRTLMTGASSGFGKSVYKFLKAKHTIFGMGLEGPDYRCDFRSMTIAQMDKILDDIGSIRALINNAGMIKPLSSIALTGEGLHETMRVNFEMPLLLTLQVLQRALARNSPLTIITTASLAIKTPPTRAVAYAASKAALETAMRSLAREYAKNNVTFISIAPGMVEDTDMQKQALQHLTSDRGMTLEQADNYTKGNPMGRLITHDELCQVFEFALERAPRSMSGTTLYIPLGSGV